MVKSIWLAVAFAAGIAVGIVAIRMFAQAPVDEALTSNAPALHRELPRETEPLTSRDSSKSRTPPVPVTARGADDVTMAKTAPANPALPPPATADASAVSQPIDAGEVFNKMFDQPSLAGSENDIGEAHRALERETRDDGWAYTMEAEIQNAMVMEVSAGAFQAEHVECRATMCELRLTGKGAQAEAIKRWSEGLGPQPFGQRLMLNYASSISDNDRVDTLMIFRRPPKASDTPKAN